MRSAFTCLIFLSVIGSTGKVYSQQNNTTDKSVVSGHFEIDKKTEKGMEHININYAISPSPFSKVLSLELSTSNPMPLSADIEDANGKKAAHWKPKTLSHQYRENIDISGLQAGSYRLQIYSGSTTPVYTISFTKEGR